MASCTARGQLQGQFSQRGGLLVLHRKCCQRVEQGEGLELALWLGGMAGQNVEALSLREPDSRGDPDTINVRAGVLSTEPPGIGSGPGKAASTGN